MSETRIATIPSFARVEMKLQNVRDILAAGEGLRALASELEKIARDLRSDEASAILAHHAVRATSKNLRGT